MAKNKKRTGITNDNQTYQNIRLDETTEERIIEKSKLTEQEMFALDALIVSTFTESTRKRLAYTMSRPKQGTDNPSSLDQLVSRFFKKPGVQYYIEDRRAELFGTITLQKESGKENEGDVLRDKERTLRELNELANSTADIKLKGEFLMKIADLQNWKKKEDEDKESRITYFAPLKCSKCPLKLSAKVAKEQQ